MDHLDRDRPDLYAYKLESVREKRQFETWLRADGLKGVSIEELSRNFKNKLRWGEDNQGREAGVLEVLVGEDLAMQVMQYGSNMNLMQEELQKNWEVFNSQAADQNNTDGLECIVQGAGTGVGQLLSSAGFNQATGITPLGLQMGPHSILSRTLFIVSTLITNELTLMFGDLLCCLLM